mgnify:CR=1 FL=1
MPQLILFLFTFLHPFYVSVTDINHNQKTKSLEISSKIFFDDLESDIEKENNLRIDILKPQNKDLINDLISKYFPQLVTNQVEISLTETKAFYDGTIDQMMMKKLQPMAWSVMGSYFAEDSERTARIKSVLGDLSKKYNAEEAQLLVAFLLKHPAKILPIIGTSKTESIKSLRKSLDINLTIEDWFTLLEASLGHKVA